MIFLWIFLLILFIILLIYNYLIVSKLIEFQIDHVNPIDICTSLEFFIKPIQILQGIVICFSLIQIRNSWPVFLIFLILFLYIFQISKKQRRYFEPMSIVRDADLIKIRHLIFIGLCGLSFVYSLIQALLEGLN